MAADSDFQLSLSAGKQDATWEGYWTVDDGRPGPAAAAAATVHPRSGTWRVAVAGSRDVVVVAVVVVDVAYYCCYYCSAIVASPARPGRKSWFVASCSGHFGCYARRRVIAVATDRRRRRRRSYSKEDQFLCHRLHLLVGGQRQQFEHAEAKAAAR